MSNTTADGLRTSLARRATVALAGAAALVGLAGVCAPGSAYAAPHATTARSAADFGDCPALPAGVDRARWKCEVHSAAPRLTMGEVTVDLAPITMTHAEGPMPDGSDGQVWGAMHTTPTAVPGGLTGTAAGDRSRPLQLAIRPEYGGRSDFYTGRFSLRFRLLSPLLPRGCVIGASTPVDFGLKRSGPSQWISQDPPLIKFSAYDDTFTAPAAENCGPLTAPLNRRLGLPAASGNLMSYDATYTFRKYVQLPTP
ncbi:hypothetical protein GCM10010503_09180 [Streptomyces lucensis JCM 4490]|uniref:Secreted protein n=1 Tax=Streptomyces lucensis JCM 4490 TaxID=1306176 RepID=A0A918IXM2_9ACTN|nr:hypothetical protein [Streptomyces lucensis]GGW35620.1 hypothetical protein GCM10010503_09180 [Streptomyces lucensis JCM 4490]